MTEAATLQSPAADPMKTSDELPRAAGRRGGGLYFIAAVVGQTSGLFRYVVLARLLGPEQVGIAATLVVTSSFFDMISDVGGERFVVQDRDGGMVEVQNLVQSVAVGRGALVALAVLICAYPAAYFYRT